MYMQALCTAIHLVITSLKGYSFVAFRNLFNVENFQKYILYENTLVFPGLKNTREVYMIVLMTSF